MITIGEKINATIPEVKRIIIERNEKKLLDLVKLQEKADYIDLNVATGIGAREQEISDMKWAITTIQNELDVSLCIDSADPEVIDAGLSIMKTHALINSTTAESESLNKILPLAKKYQSSFIALAMDENGIPKTTEGRIDSCRKIVNECKKIGITLNHIFFDPLMLPIATDPKQSKVTLDTLSTIKKEFPETSTVIGLSNVSFGLPARININIAFLQMAIYAGLDAAILDPTELKLINAILSAEAVIGKDRHFRRYNRVFHRLRSVKTETLNSKSPLKKALLN
ncbi:MAG: dihydropteroate synthase [Desulfobacterales bacterium]|nr:dihydropteroate synthase [Desulfobacterales bacterium]